MNESMNSLLLLFKRSRLYRKGCLMLLNATFLFITKLYMYVYIYVFTYTYLYFCSLARVALNVLKHKKTNRRKRKT